MRVPYPTECYWNLIDMFHQMGSSPIGVEGQRIRLHQEILDHYDITRDGSLEVLHNLDRYKNALQMHNALLKVKENEGE